MFSTHSVISISLLLVLLVSLTLNGVLFYTAKHYYTRAKLAEVFPTHESYYQQANATLPQKTQKRVVLFGNSRIQNWKKPPQLDGFEFINRGIGGETTAQNQARFLKDVLALQPDVVPRLALIFLATLGHYCPVWAINWFIKKYPGKKT